MSCGALLDVGCALLSWKFAKDVMFLCFACGRTTAGSRVRRVCFLGKLSGVDAGLRGLVAWKTWRHGSRGWTAV